MFLKRVVTLEAVAEGQPIPWGWRPIGSAGGGFHDTLVILPAPMAWVIMAWRRAMTWRRRRDLEIEAMKSRAWQAGYQAGVADQIQRSRNKIELTVKVVDQASPTLKKAVEDLCRRMLDVD